MATVFCIGEVLIDFIPLEKGKALKDVCGFERAPGGAPANVSAAVSIYGGKSVLITQVGIDGFGDFLLEQLQEAGVNTQLIQRTKIANTGLAFVSLREDGERDFSFYRNPSADLLYDKKNIQLDWFTEGDFLHYCSVDLVESPMKEAHEEAIKLATQKGALISFDPNIRLPLWENKEECRKTVQSFIPKSHLIKISDEELFFVTGIEDVDAAIQSLFVGEVVVVIYTKGASGADIYTKTNKYTSLGYKVDVQDTTGAGDAFIGAFLYQLTRENATIATLEKVIEQKSQHILAFANASGALTTTKKGAISALPTLEEITILITEKE